MSGYAELAALTNFSFLRGASRADEMVETASALGLAALGIADRNTLAGVVRAHCAAKEAGLRLLVGARLVTVEDFETIAYPKERLAYGRLSRLLTKGNRRSKKGECHLKLDDLCGEAEGQIFIVMPPEWPQAAFREKLKTLAAAAPGRTYLAAAWLYRGGDEARLEILAAIAQETNAPLVAVNDAHFHDRSRRALADVLTCVREKTTITGAGRKLAQNAERHLKAPAEMARLFARYPDAIARTLAIAAQVSFSLDQLRYEYPDEAMGSSATPQDELIRLAWEGASARYPDGVAPKVKHAIAHELRLITELNYAPYFLTVWDIVSFARSRGILCQGRGSAANSAVCYCLGITSVDPARMDLLFERFVSAERNEPPDIDVDFEHERREEVIQYIYEKYGRHRAGIAGTVISYRWRSAIRDVGKAMGLSLDAVGKLAQASWGWSEGVTPEELRAHGFDLSDRNLKIAVALACELIGFPRHLSQHVGGFVITRGPLDEVVPIGNGAMPDRTFVEWDKDDLDALGILKVDVLGLGMLTCIAKAFALLKRHYGVDLTLASLPAEDPAVYDMLCNADSVGVFQVESRAQMSMLPRLKPRNFYDLVIEVAIVRPGPIQGDMVHPYLRRREGKERVEYPSEELRQVLGKTLGVPLFQEQAMKIAIVAAGFTPSEADRLRRAMATFRKVGTIHTFRAKLIEGMVARGYHHEFAERCFQQIEGFGEYGFPESHAASFALIVYVSAWLKCHYPDVFAAAILNAQPMGFYAPAQLVRDACGHDVEVRAPDVNCSKWDHTLEPATRGARPFALRLGLCQVNAFREEHGRLICGRRESGYDSVRDLWLRTRLPSSALERLADADAFQSLGLNRRDALWAVRGIESGAAARMGAKSSCEPLPLFAAASARDHAAEEEAKLPRMTLGEEVVSDYSSLRLSLKAHPLSFLRKSLDAKGIVPANCLAAIVAESRVSVAGLVLVRQRPGTASGVIFATLEDETGVANIIIWPKTFEAHRRIVLGARLLRVTGKLQREAIVMHVVADMLEDMTDSLAILSYDHTEMGDAGLARADEVKRPGNDVRVALAQRARERWPKSRDFH